MRPCACNHCHRERADNRAYLRGCAALCFGGAIFLALILLGLAGCHHEPATTAADLEVAADLQHDDLIVDRDLTSTNVDLASVATDLATADLTAPWCGELLQHVCPDDAPHPGCRDGLVAMARGNDPDDLHCFDPSECGATTGSPCCSVNGGTTTVAWGYCPLPMRCQATCQ